MKTERQLRKEMRIIGLTTKILSDKFNVSMQTINNWISGRIFLPPSVAVKLQDMGIPKKAIRNPSDMV